MSLFGSGKWACPTDPSLTSPSRMRFDRSLCPAAFSQGLARATKGGASGHGAERPLTYGAGIDPAWHGARTELQFLNSVKMKMSIVLGVVQMNAGIAMSLLNQRSERDRLSTLTEFIPQVLFLNALFGYLCFLILLKWATGSTADLYHTLIYMFLSPGEDFRGFFPGFFWGRERRQDERGESEEAKKETEMLTPLVFNFFRQRPVDAGPEADDPEEAVGGARRRERAVPPRQRRRSFFLGGGQRRRGPRRGRRWGARRPPRPRRARQQRRGRRRRRPRRRRRRRPRRPRRRRV